MQDARSKLNPLDPSVVRFGLSCLAFHPPVGVGSSPYVLVASS
jgi:hypothetical protein